MVADLVTIGCLLLGTIFTLLAAVGMVRMPDLFLRLQAMTKAVTFGVGWLLVAVVVAFWNWEVAIRAAVTMAFVAATIPVATQLIARAAFHAGTPLWGPMVVNEFPTDQGPQAGAPPPGKDG